MKLKIVGVIGLLALATIHAEETTDLKCIRNALDALEAACVSNRWDYWTIEDAIDFEWFREESAYRRFALVVSNNWSNAILHLSELSTNDFERLLMLGAGKSYDEDFYIDYIDTIATMTTNNIVSARELSWARASKRFDLNSCLIRRYQEPKVVELVNKLNVVMPQQESRWNDILSGAAYTNYLEEVAMGLWQ